MIVGKANACVLNKVQELFPNTNSSPQLLTTNQRPSPSPESFTIQYGMLISLHGLITKSKLLTVIYINSTKAPSISTNKLKKTSCVLRLIKVVTTRSEDLELCYSLLDSCRARTL